MTKKIKSFTVDESAYDSLVKIFKETQANASVSLFVNNCIKQLAELLDEMDGFLAKSRDYNVPMSFIIKSIVEDSDILGMNRGLPAEYRDIGSDLRLMEWQEQYDELRGKVPAEFEPFIHSGLYRLSPNRRYIIHEKTGQRYVSDGKKLFPVRTPGLAATPSKKITRRK